MPYYIGYKGKKLGSALSRQQAEEKLNSLSRCFNELVIIKERKQSVPIGMLESMSEEIEMDANAFIHPTFENSLYSEQT